MKRLFVSIVIVVVMLNGCGGCGGTKSVGDGITPPTAGPTPIGDKLSGVCLGPYLTGNPDNGDEVSESNLRTYLGLVAVNFSSCRSYGSTLGLEKFPAIAKGLGLKVSAGCWLGKDMDANEKEVKSLINNCKVGTVDVAIVGSEVLLRGDMTEDQLLGYMARVKATGVTITTAEEWKALLKHPRIIAACDVVYANIYPFWEGVVIADAITRLQSDYNQVVAASGGKKVVISETGWPSDGSANMSAVPSPENQAKYFSAFVSWATAKNVEYYYFSMFDEPWKTEPGLVGPHWGLWDSTMKLKPGCEGGFKAPLYVVPTPVPTPEPTPKPLPSFIYTPIADVPKEVNELGKRICQEQRNVVTPGGNEWSPGFSSYDQSVFESSGELNTIVSTVTASSTFKVGVASIRTLSAEDQERVLVAYAKPLYPTWAMNGHIGSDGTTNAGYAVEGQIATALTNAVKAAL